MCTSLRSNLFLPPNHLSPCPKERSIRQLPIFAEINMCANTQTLYPHTLTQRHDNEVSHSVGALPLNILFLGCESCSFYA